MPDEKALVDEVVDVGIQFALEGHTPTVGGNGQINMQAQEPFEYAHGLSQQAVDQLTELNVLLQHIDVDKDFQGDAENQCLQRMG